MRGEFRHGVRKTGGRTFEYPEGPVVGDAVGEVVREFGEDAVCSMPRRQPIVRDRQFGVCLAIAEVWDTVRALVRRPLA